MPELPDVETFRGFLNRTAIGQPIEKIDVDELILRGVSARTLQAQVREKKFDSTVRHVKYVFDSLLAGYFTPEEWAEAAR